MLRRRIDSAAKTPTQKDELGPPSETRDQSTISAEEDREGNASSRALVFNARSGHVRRSCERPHSRRRACTVVQARRRVVWGSRKREAGETSEQRPNAGVERWE